jgi:hypothetical protein
MQPGAALDRAAVTAALRGSGVGVVTVEPLHRPPAPR